MSSFFYNYIAAQSLIKGKKTALYLSRFIFQIYRSLPILLKLAVASFRFFHLFYTSCYSLINLQFWLLTLNHFMIFYQSIFFLRILIEYFYINTLQSNNFVKIIFFLSEPYLKMIHLIPLPDGILKNIFGFSIISFLSFLIKKACWILLKYQNNSSNLKEVKLLLNAVLDEKIVFS